MSNQFDVQTILELSCAAQRVNGRYIKEIETLFTDDGKVGTYVFDNKFLVLFTIGELNWNAANPPQRLVITEEDKELAKSIREFYKRLAFAVMADPDNSYLSEVFALLHTEKMAKNKIGFLASLPGTYVRDKSNNTLKKHYKQCEDGYLGQVDEIILDKDAEIIHISKSKNYEGWNVNAVIDNKMVSWFSKSKLELGPCVVIKARVSAHGKHWKLEFDETRLNYVKAAQ